jgi:hypothetical protein
MYPLFYYISYNKLVFLLPEHKDWVIYAHWREMQCFLSAQCPLHKKMEVPACQKALLRAC